MSGERVGVSRRFLLKAGSVGLAAAAAGIFVPDYLIWQRHNGIETDRKRYVVPERIVLDDESIIVGTAPDRTNPNHLNDYERILGIRPGIVHRLHRFGEDDDTQLVHQIGVDLDNGYLPMISCGPSINDVASKRRLFSIIREASAYRRPILYRIWFEINTPWAEGPWYGSPSQDQFDEMWDELYNHCKEFCDTPNLVYGPNATPIVNTHSVLHFTPNPQQFRVLAADIYNFKSIYRTSPDYYAHDFFSPNIALGKDIYEFATDPNTNDKPLILAEVNDKLEIYSGAWTAELINYAVRHGACAAVTYDEDRRDAGEIAWSVLRHPDKVRCLSAEFSNSYYLHEPRGAEAILAKILSQPLNRVLPPTTEWPSQ